MLKSSERESLYARIIRRIKRNSKALQAVLRKLGIEDISQLPSFEYPFTEKHNMFMRRITNGNLREVFDIASDTLIYMFDKKTKTTIRREGEEERISIGREGDLQLFMGRYENKISSYKMIDLFSKKSRQGNSLLLNVLELVKLRQVVDDTFYDFAESYGYRKRDVDYAIQELSDKVNRLITPLRMYFLRKHSAQEEVHEFTITEKGEYYLQICDWKAYRDRCGERGKSLLEEYKP